MIRHEFGPPIGKSSPIGATLVPGGGNFSVFSRHAGAIDLLLFDRLDDKCPSHVLPLDPALNRTYHYWHAFVPHLHAGQVYGFRARGEFAPDRGRRFDESKVLLDPYARAIAVPKGYSRNLARQRGDNTASAMKSVVADTGAYDWENDAPLRTPWSHTVIYELHVRGFTAHANSNVQPSKRGTYAGLIEKIPYLQQLGVTAVELLPVFQFDPQDAPPGLSNYWGYSPVSFFAPHHGYSSRQDPLGALDEFRDMVKALHRVGIEVILDVVYNHTAEGDHEGPTLCLRGLDNPTYYVLGEDRSRYADFTGTGNTLNANHPVVRRMILDSLRYWVSEMHVDGFRFDLASILTRDSSGAVMANPPVLWDIESDPVLAGTKMIAEAWDAAGLYQVGSFVGDSWKEWNDQFRNDVRDFFRGSRDCVRRIADRLIGSPSIYGHRQREAEESINFATCHDGLTLNDLVTYGEKHNEANGEGNRDGRDDNRSWNCGIEGPTTSVEIESLRNRQIKNIFAATLLSVGVPMFVMGDEVRRTQRGNNNPYCQDNDTSWFDWSQIHEHADILRFVRLLLAHRVRRSDGYEQRRACLSDVLREANCTWHGVKLNQPDWSVDSHSLALSADLRQDGLLMHVILNAYWRALDFELPRARHWRRWIDTSLESPNDICDWHSAPPVCSETYRAVERSIVVLVGAESDRNPAETEEATQNDNSTSKTNRN